MPTTTRQFLALAAALAVGVLLGRASIDRPGDLPRESPNSQETSDRETHSAVNARPDDEGGRAASPEAIRVAELEAQLAAQQFVIDSLEAEMYGVPIEWTDDLPEKYMPAAFEANLLDAIEDCGLSIEVFEFDCSEPPCLAKFRRDKGKFSSDDDWYQGLMNCEAWTATYGTSLGLATGPVECSDGTIEGYTLVGVSPPKPSPPKGPNGEQDWGEWYASLDEDTKAEMENSDKRFQTRLQAATQSWACAAAE